MTRPFIDADQFNAEVGSVTIQVRDLVPGQMFWFGDPYWMRLCIANDRANSIVVNVPVYATPFIVMNTAYSTALNPTCRVFPGE